MDKKSILDPLWTARWYLKKGLSSDALPYVSKAIDILEGKPEITPIPEVPTRDRVGGNFIPPTIEVLSTNIKPAGKYQTKSGKPKGLVVHWTMGKIGGRATAISMLNWLGDQGYGCMVMDEDGVIYIPKELGYENWDHHAGSSSWKGVDSVSRLCMGIEICCPGKLMKYKDQFYAEYDFNKWGNASSGLKKSAKPVPAEKIRYSPKNGHIDEGHYFKYTEAQEEALINFCLMQKQINPEFDLDWVVGHDEVAPNRKADPGASLSMTMPEFRRMLKEAL